MMQAKPKIFGLGLSKTGTSSLNEALNILGIQSVHYPYDEQTYDELRAGQYRLTILEQNQAITDLPATPFYAQFDQVYPGSKFILTVREQEAWLRSCEMHWRLLSQWQNNFPQFQKFQEFISACVFGTLAFQRDRFAYVYEQHVRNVCEYFKDRPDDFLLLDICAGEGWETLCRFLDVAVPDVAFPRANDWMHRLMEAAQESCAVIPIGETFILVDEQGFGSEFAAGRRHLPFLERDGQYWGAPPDAETAIHELERLRQTGATYIVFGWPSFWWLEYYAALHNYLRREYACLLENERVIIFALHKTRS